MNLGATEPVNGSWIQAIAQEYGVMNPVNGSWIQAIANSLGATDAVNGSWFQAIANQLGTYTLTDNPTWLEEWAKLTELPPVAPVADFMTSNTNPVENVEIQFIDLTLNIPTSWLWNFGDGTTSCHRSWVHRQCRRCGSWNTADRRSPCHPWCRRRPPARQLPWLLPRRRPASRPGRYRPRRPHRRVRSAP